MTTPSIYIGQFPIVILSQFFSTYGNGQQFKHISMNFGMHGSIRVYGLNYVLVFCFKAMLPVGHVELIFHKLKSNVNP